MIQAVYNHLAQEYINRQPEASLKKVHKRSELRTIYNTIIRISRTTPLYKVNLIPANQGFALGLKEASMNLASCIDELMNSRETSVFHTQKAVSGNENSASVQIAANHPEQFPEAFRLTVDALAGTQINKGIPVPKRRLNPSTGNYTFVAHVEDESYEFQFNIGSDSTNEDNLKKLSEFINRNDIGIHASIEATDEDSLRMVLESKDTGNLGEPIFRLEDVSSENSNKGIVEHYGLNQIVREASNASFTINGESKEAVANSILLNQTVRVDFNGVSEEPFDISYIPDDDQILTSLRRFRKKYNKMIRLANEYTENPQMKDKLIRTLSSGTAPFENELEAAGITFNKEGFMKINESLARHSIEQGEMEKLFSEDGFASGLLRQSQYVTLNPMDYVDKKLITYPNLSKPGFSHPYVTSLYSGMIFNFYC